MTLNALAHPIRALRLAVRRWTLRADATHPDVPGAIPPSLEPFWVGETLPWKGTKFKVVKIVGGEYPAIILVPVGRTHGATLHGLRDMRDLGRAHLKRDAGIRAALAGETRRS